MKIAAATRRVRHTPPIHHSTDDFGCGLGGEWRRVSSGVNAGDSGRTADARFRDTTGTTRYGSVGISAFGSPAGVRAGWPGRRTVGPRDALGVGVAELGPTFPGPKFGAGAGWITRSRNSGTDFNSANGPALSRLTRIEAWSPSVPSAKFFRMLSVDPLTVCGLPSASR